MNRLTRRVLFLLFFLSGFSGLVYQVVWTRLAFAAFGIITPVLSVVISVFMLGLSIGSWAGGKYIGWLKNRTGLSALRFYALAELTISLGAFAVPFLFTTGERWLLATGQSDSARYLLLSALMLAISILPWCVCMGTTFPFVMAYVREQGVTESRDFSYLYLANVLGAMTGIFMAAWVFIELFGFHDTLRIAAVLNIIVGCAAFRLGSRRAVATAPRAAGPLPSLSGGGSRPVPETAAKAILFSTGFGSMAMEVIWTRAFTPVLKTQVYSFAMIVFAYLGATCAGSLWYRRDLRRGKPRSVPELLALLAVVVFIPVLVNDLRILQPSSAQPLYLPHALVLLAAICPFCGVLGYLTPGLIDAYAGGDPARTGRSYAINVLGCILGPLAASYLLLPVMSEKAALLLLSVPCLVAAFGFFPALSRPWRMGLSACSAIVVVWSLVISQDFETYVSKHVPNTVIRRDHVASVISCGEGLDKELLVNGVGMTKLTPVTKFMLHLPLAFHRGPPESALIICFGMGTTFRSALSWNVDTTAVELVPSVRDAFGFYFADAPECLNNPKGRIVIDDGRRFLQRTRQSFDVIVIDPPPPVEAAGSSLLYSQEFYDAAKRRLKPNGILQAWFPGGEQATAQAVLRSIHNSFPYVRCFGSVAGWGIHMLASMEPIENATAAKLIARMPESARKDLLEWAPGADLSDYLNQVLAREFPATNALNPDPSVKIDDDQPYNEYFLLRRYGL